MNCRNLNEIENDEIYFVKKHFFIIEDLKKSNTYELSEIILKNYARELKLEFYFGEHDLIYDNLFYITDYWKSDFDLNSLKGKLLKLEFNRKHSSLEISNITFYRNSLKEEFPKQYKELVLFSIQNLNWFLQGLSKHVGITFDILEFLSNGSNIDYLNIYLLNKFLSYEELLKNLNLIELHEEFVVQNQSPFLWSKSLLQKIFSYNNDFFGDIDEEKECKLRNFLSLNNELINSEIFLFQNYQYFDWNIISASEKIVWSIDKIVILRDFLNWDILSSNPSLPWNKQLIEAFSEKWNWSKLSTNIGINWNPSLLNEFNQSKDWSYHKTNHFNLNDALININIEDWNWNNLSKKHDLPWSNQFIRKFSYKWDWSILCQNKSINWNNSILEENHRNIDWWSLSKNDGTFWTKEMVIQYYDELKLEELSRNSGLPWSREVFRLLKYDKDYKEIMTENPLLEEKIWHQIYDGYLSDDFIYDVIIQGVYLKSEEPDFSL
jgi:hypothetical protein